MPSNRPIRLLRKRGQPTNSEPAVSGSTLKKSEPSEREMRTVVSRWVLDHKTRSEEFRRTFARLWRSGEFHLNHGK